MVIRDFLNSTRKDSTLVLTLNFSSRTNSLEVQKNIEAMCDRRTPTLYGPKGKPPAPKITILNADKEKVYAASLKYG